MSSTSSPPPNPSKTPILSSAASPPGRLSPLHARLRRELAALPTTHWGYLFPCSVAVWHHLYERHPGTFGQLNAGYAEAPWFAGRGARWFVRDLETNPIYQRLCDQILGGVIDALGPEKIAQINLREAELPPIDEGLVAELAALLEFEVARGITIGALSNVPTASPVH